MLKQILSKIENKNKKKTAKRHLELKQQILPTRHDEAKLRVFSNNDTANDDDDVDDIIFFITLVFPLRCSPFFCECVSLSIIKFFFLLFLCS